MKKLIGVALLFIAFSTLKAQEKFSLSGRLTALTEDKIARLEYIDSSGKTIQDSVLVKDGRFAFKGIVDGPTKAKLLVAPIKLNPDHNLQRLAIDYVDIFLEAGDIIVTGTDKLRAATLKGGPVLKEQMLLNAQTQPFKDMNRKNMVEYVKLMKLNDTAAMSKNLSQDVSEQIYKAEEDFIFQHPDSYVSVELVKSRANPNYPGFETVYKVLSKRMHESKTGKQIDAQMAIYKKLSLGNTMKFTQNDTSGKPFTLSSLKGKYVLVDFWASWCGPCRAENPNVVKAYGLLKDKNFEIVGVSLDKAKGPWIAAIKKDGLPWIHVSDLNYWRNQIAVDYGVVAVPQNVLLDPNGIIIAKNLRGEELYDKLLKLIK